MTFNEHSPEVLEAIRCLYHKAVGGSISAALLEAIRFGYELAKREQEPIQ